MFSRIGPLVVLTRWGFYRKDLARHFICARGLCLQCRFDWIRLPRKTRSWRHVLNREKLLLYNKYRIKKKQSYRNPSNIIKNNEETGPKFAWGMLRNWSIFIFLDLLYSNMKLKIVQNPGNFVKSCVQFFYRKTSFCSTHFFMNKW